MKLAETVTFGGGGLERAAHLRGDDAALRELEARDDAGTVLLWHGRVLMTGDALTLLPAGHALVTGPTAFLGMTPDGAPRFAAELTGWTPEDGATSTAPGWPADDRPYPPGAPAGSGFADLRATMAELSALDAELAATARGLFEWHRSHGFCANCGTRSDIDLAGWRRVCPTCGRQHFPRTDPVVIMLVTHGDRVLLGRSPGWPDRMYSLLAGFMEPGETMEAAVRREVFEEVGLRCGRVDYLSSQPWAFPSSLMLGCRTEALDTALNIDPVEIADARWLTRAEALSALSGTHPDIARPRHGAIAEFLLRNWLADQLG